MKVTLIHYTGMGHPDPLFAARLLVYTKDTRLTQGEGARAKVAAMSEQEILESLDYISNTIRSSWEFIDFTFEITGVSRAMANQMTRTRIASFAQQSMRTVDMGDQFEYVTGPSLGIPDSSDGYSPSAAFIEYSDMMSAIGSTYRSLVDMGVPTEDARGILPLNICTSLIAKFNLRTIADMCPKRDNARAQGEYVNVFRQMVARILEVMPWAEHFMYPERLQTPALDKIIKDMLDGRTPYSMPEINAALKEVDKLKATWG